MKKAFMFFMAVIVSVFLIKSAMAAYEYNGITGKLDKTRQFSGTIVDFDPSLYGGVNWGDSDLNATFTWCWNSAAGDSKPCVTFGDGEFTFNQPVTVFGTNSRFLFQNSMEWNGKTARKMTLKGGTGTNNEEFSFDNDILANALTVTSSTGGNLLDLIDIGVRSNTFNRFGNISVGTYGNSSNIIAAAGNVSIGTAYAVAKTAPANGMIVEGNVGVGTWVPATKLQVVGTISATAFQTDSTTAGTISLFEDGANGSNKINFVAPSSVASDRTCTLEDDDTPLDGCVTGGAGSSGWTDGGTVIYASTTTDKVGIGTSLPSYLLTIGKDVATATDTPLLSLGSQFSTSTPSPDKAKFLTFANGSGSYGIGVTNQQQNYFTGASNADHVFYQGSTELARIAGGGNVGIGTNIPVARLAIQRTDTTAWTNGNGSLARMLIINGDSSTTNSFQGLGFSTKNSINAISTVAAIDAITHDHGSSTVTGSLAFSTRNNNAYSTKMYIKSDGNVGVGTIAPVQKLQVVGTIQASSFVSSDGSAGVTGATCTAWKNGLCTSL